MLTNLSDERIIRLLTNRKMEGTLYKFWGKYGRKECDTWTFVITNVVKEGKRWRLQCHNTTFEDEEIRKLSGTDEDSILHLTYESVMNLLNSKPLKSNLGDGLVYYQKLTWMPKEEYMAFMRY